MPLGKQSLSGAWTPPPRLPVGGLGTGRGSGCPLGRAAACCLPACPGVPVWGPYGPGGDAQAGWVSTHWWGEEWGDAQQDRRTPISKDRCTGRTDRQTPIRGVRTHACTLPAPAPSDPPLHVAGGVRVLSRVPVGCPRGCWSLSPRSGCRMRPLSIRGPVGRVWVSPPDTKGPVWMP